MTIDDLVCVVCEGARTARRWDCITCSPAWEERRTAILGLLRGERGTASCVQDYLGSVFGRSSGEASAEAGEKSRIPPRRDSRTSRAEEWLWRRVRERPGHLTRATRLFVAYRAWAQCHDPEGPFGYTAFIRAVDRAAPIEGRVRLMTECGGLSWRFKGSCRPPPSGLVRDRRGRQRAA